MAKQAEKYIKTMPWSIVEEGFHAGRNAVSESLFSIGNEYCGVRGYAEEGSAAQGLQGCYFNGIYEWAKKANETAYKGIIKRGHYMVNAVNPVRADLFIDGERVDMAAENVSGFYRSLDFKSGLYLRSYTVKTARGKVKLAFSRFLSMTDVHNLYQKIEIEPDYPAEIKIYAATYFNVTHGGKKGRWKTVYSSAEGGVAKIVGKTQSTGQYLACAQKVIVSAGTLAPREEKNAAGVEVTAVVNGSFTLEKRVNFYADKSGEFGVKCAEKAVAPEISFNEALSANKKYYEKFWAESDIGIEGDDENQQGIRFCIFQLQQTYHGISPTDNIGAKGLTGEAYSGHAFWDTETYCLPYFLFNNLDAAKDLLLFRYHTLGKAKERAKELDCEGACYPIATLNGNEACDLWQHASLQFQPSTGVAYGIRQYVEISGDEQFLPEYGMEMLLEICRFLRSRGEYGADGRFGYFCVMGPDEFQMMVNHNCYTNYMAKKTFEYALATFEKYPERAKELGATEEEKAAFAACARDMYIPYDEESKLFEQHDGFFRLPHVDVKKIPITDFPLYHHWSYDRIYRNDMIKQPDVLMFMLLFGGDFTFEQKLKNYEYYEPRCIHESSLSPSVHSILASELKKHDEALSFFGFASRLDLDDYNRNTCEGLHTTSIAAAWLNIVYGFGGVRNFGGVLNINPSIPEIWRGYSFKLNYRGANIAVKVTRGRAEISCDGEVPAVVCGKNVVLSGDTVFEI